MAQLEHRRELITPVYSSQLWLSVRFRIHFLKIWFVFPEWPCPAVRLLAAPLAPSFQVSKISWPAARGYVEDTEEAQGEQGFSQLMEVFAVSHYACFKSALKTHLFHLGHLRKVTSEWLIWIDSCICIG